MPRCKAPEILRSEAYMEVRRNDEGRGQRRRWAFFSSLLVDPLEINVPSLYIGVDQPHLKVVPYVDSFVTVE